MSKKRIKLNGLFSAVSIAAILLAGCGSEAGGSNSAGIGNMADNNAASSVIKESLAAEGITGTGKGTQEAQEPTTGTEELNAATDGQAAGSEKSEPASYEQTTVRGETQAAQEPKEPGTKPLGDTGRPFVNDYDSSDRTYDASDNYISPKGNRGYGETYTVSYYSSTIGAMRNADVILPYGYNHASSYPVLYMLHGMGGNNKSWSDMGVKYIVQNLHYENNVPDMIVVCVDCFVSTAVQSEVAISEMGRAYDRVENELINDLMPYINTHYSTKTGRGNTAIAGYSLGGRGALAIGFKHQNEFGYIGAFSAASGVIPNGSGRSVLSTQMSDFVLEYGDFPMLFINVGETDGICGNSCRFYDEALTARGIKHIFYEMEGDHEGSVWQNGLYNFVKRIF